MAIGMVLTFMVVFIMCATAFDAGVWYFDHRRAQTQAEAAALAAASHLPAVAGSVEEEVARQAARDWLVKNGASLDDVCGIDFSDFNGSGKDNQVRVCVRRQAPGTFSKLSGINAAYVSAAAKARIGPVGISSVLPWYVAAPDPTCTATAGRPCRADYNYDGDITDLGERTCSFNDCPFGLDLNAVFMFKGSSGGNSGAIQACDQGANNYKACIEGLTASGFFETGSSVQVSLKPGNMGVNTANPLDVRYPSPSMNTLCDVAISPIGGLGTNANQTAAYDPAGKARAVAKFDTNPPNEDCRLRLVIIPVFSQAIPQNGSATVTVLGIAVFGIANWADPGNKTFGAPSAQDCRVLSGNSVPNGEWDCGMVWGYLFSGIDPPSSLLQQISNTNDPLAPLMIALVD
jgi:hypothetical protein